MDQRLDILVLILTTIILFYIFFQTYRLLVGNKKLNKSIIDHFQCKGFIVLSISKLNINERIKYRVSLIPILWIYSQFFGFLSDRIDLVRKVELSSKSGKEYIKYIELQIQRNDSISVNEIDSYEY